MNLTEQYTQETGNRPVTYQLASKESDKKIQVVESSYVQWLEDCLREARTAHDNLVDKIIKEPKYIPYESLEEIPDVFEKPIWLKEIEDEQRMVLFSSLNINCSLGYTFKEYTYLDGTPFGKKVEL